MKHSNRMDARPSFQFYPDDWLSETGLRLCDLAARGLWIDLLCHMFKSPKRGLLYSRANQMGSREIAQLVGRPIAEVKQSIDQLIRYGVCETTADGTIYSRRLVREAARHDSKVMAGKIGAEKRWHSKAIAKHGSTTPSTTTTPSSTTKDKRLSSRKRDKSAPEILQIWEYYQETVGRKRCILTDNRIRKITRRLERWSVAEMKKAIDNLAASDWHMGRDAKSEGRKYNDLEQVIRNDERVEHFLNLEPERFEIFPDCEGAVTDDAE